MHRKMKNKKWDNFIIEINFAFFFFINIFYYIFFSYENKKINFKFQKIISDRYIIIKIINTYYDLYLY